MVGSVASYGCEAWLLKIEEQRKLLVLEMDYLRSASVFRLQKIPNTTIRSNKQAEQSILDRIQRRQLKWYGHLLRMEDSCWQKKIYQWTPHGRRRGRPQQSWRNQVMDFMRSRNMETLAFGSAWIALGCIDPNTNNIIIREKLYNAMT